MLYKRNRVCSTFKSLKMYHFYLTHTSSLAFASWWRAVPRIENTRTTACSVQTLILPSPYNYMIYMMSIFVPKREASPHSLTVRLHNRSHTHTQSFSSIAIPRVSLLHALTSVSSTLQAHHSHTSPSHDLSASDIMPMLPHCPTYKWREGAVEEDDSGG